MTWGFGSMGRLITSLLEMAHEAAGKVLVGGDLAVDATLGNGCDAVHLALCVGPRGRVIGFDVQAEAIAASRARLGSAGLVDRVVLLAESHERVAARASELGEGRPLRVVMFNLGYRPGGSHAIVTEAGTTVAALEAAFSELATPGLITVVSYVGHAGGRAEHEAVRRWAGGLDLSYRGPRSGRPRVIESRFLHGDHETGSLFLVERPIWSRSEFPPVGISFPGLGRIRE